MYIPFNFTKSTVEKKYIANIDHLLLDCSLIAHAKLTETGFLKEI